MMGLRAIWRGVLPDDLFFPGLSRAVYNPVPVSSVSSPLGLKALTGLLAVLLTGASLRLWGVGTGAPYRMGVDEPVIMRLSFDMVKNGDPNPHFFHYGGLTFTFHAGVSAISFLDRAMAGRWSNLSHAWYGDFLEASRTATALLGTLTILVVFLIARRWSLRVAFVAAGIMAVFPPHVREAHFALTDTPVALLVALTLLASIRAAEAGTTRAVIWAGAAAGLAVSAKYNAAIACLLPATATLSFPYGQRLRALAWAAAASVGAFLLAAPYTLLDLPAFLNDVAFLMQSYNRGTFSGSFWTYVGHLRNGFGWPGVLPLSFGYLALVLSTLGLLIAAVKTPPDVPLSAAAMLVVFPLVFFLFTAGQRLVYGRYLLPLGPLLAIGLATSLVTAADLVARRSRMLSRAALPVMLLLIVGPMAAAAVAWNVEFVRPVTIDQAAQWVARRTAKGDVVIYEGSVFYAPPSLTLQHVPRLIDKSLDEYRADGVTYLVTSSEIADTYRAGTPAHAAHLALVSQAEVVQTFAPTPRRGGATFTILRVPR